MIELKDIQGNQLLSVAITQSCQKVEELMAADYIQLSWNSDLSDELPLGAYIEYNGERYSLLEPYKPTQKDESEYTYTPKFESRVRAWGKKPFFFYSGQSKEPDWTLTSNPADFMRCVCDAIREETGESWTYSIDASLPASASLSFSSSDILSGLNQIAGAFETEWFADKETNTLYLGLLSHGSEVTLEVGENISVPSVQSSREGYYTRFYAFGSTRNITQDYSGSNTNNLVNKRLTLDPNKYPQGYKDIRGGLSEGEIFSKVLIFDDVYPSAKLSISDVRNRLMYLLDESGNKIQLGTDDSGNPIYDQYTIWYFRIEGFTFDWENVIDGLTPSISFQSGALNGREFEIIYYNEDKKITTSDGIVFEAKQGDYEIKFIEENNLIIPAMTGLVPSDGDEVVLFNIKMPSEYTQSAYAELEEELDKAIARMTSDLRNYSFKSNPVAFNENNPNLSIGRKVRYVNGNYSYSTRVIKLTTQLDFPIEQSITIGNEKVKGNTQQLKEEVASANKDLNLLAVFNEMTQTIQQSYNRTQQMMLDGFAAIKNIWQLRETESGEKYLFTEFNVVTQMGITSFANNKVLDLPNIYDGLPIDNQTLYWEEVKEEAGTDEEGNPIYKTTKVLKARSLGEGGEGGSTGGGLSAAEIKTLIESYGYLTESKLPIASNSVKGIASFNSEQFSVSNGVVSFVGNTNNTPDLSAYVTKAEFFPFQEEFSLFVSVVNQHTVSIRDIKTTYATQAWVLEAISGLEGGSGGSVADTITWDKVIGKPSWLSDNVINYDEIIGVPDLSKYATKDYVNDAISSLGSSGGGVVDSIAWSKVYGKPTWLNDDVIHYTEIEGTPNLNNYALKTELPNLSEYVDINSEQTITGKKNFTTGGLFVNGKQVKYNSEGYWMLEGDLLVTGDITSFASASGFTPSTVMDGVVVDGVTIIKQNGALVVVGGGSSDGGDSGVSPDLSAYATKTWVSQNFATSSQLSTLSGTVANKANISDVYTKIEVDTKISAKWTTDNQKIANWDAAYGWGNHANAGYVKSSSLTETLKSYVTVGGEEQQEIKGQKNFTGGLLVNGQELVYNKDDGYWKMEGNLLVTGGITSYSSDGKATPFLIDVDKWNDISSDSATQVYTANATSLLKAQLETTDTNATSALNKIATLKTSLNGLSATNVSALVTALKNIANSL